MAVALFRGEEEEEREILFGFWEREEKWILVEPPTTFDALTSNRF